MTCHTLEEFYHINGRSFEKQYKETLSGYRSWDQLSHAQKWLLFEDNIGKNIAIDETSLSNVNSIRLSLIGTNTASKDVLLPLLLGPNPWMSARYWIR